MFPLQCLSHLFAISGVSSQISICIKKPPVCGSMDPFWMKAFWTILPFMDVDLWQKMTFNGRWPLTEDNLWWKMTFDGRRPPVFLLFLKHHFGPNIFKTQHFLTIFFYPEIKLYTNISLPPTFSRYKFLDINFFYVKYLLNQIWGGNSKFFKFSRTPLYILII